MCPLRRTEPIVVTPPVLRERPLPAIDASVDKHERGVALIVGGSSDTPGAVLLAGVAALRAGAGTLQLATAASAAPALRIAVPEARVVGVRETDGGEIDADDSDALVDLVEEADSVLIGTGMLAGSRSAALVGRLLPHLRDDARVIVDAGGLYELSAVRTELQRLSERAAAIPNPKEMGALVDRDAESVRSDPQAALAAAIEQFGVVVALRDADTWVSAPGAPIFWDRSGHPAMATSGSGDVLAGFLTGLAARGTGLLDATLWAARVHGDAGARVAARVGGVGLLARELLDELPIAMAAIGP
jgi:ADP-dependent NAD(P)H-hydrate dehydratase